MTRKFYVHVIKFASDAQSSLVRRESCMDFCAMRDVIRRTLTFKYSTCTYKKYL